MSLYMPVDLLFIVAPKVSAESSIIFNLCLEAIFLIPFQSGIFPIKFGINKAFVFLEIFFSILLRSIWSVFISQSTKIGFKLHSIIEETAVPKLRHGAIISLPLGKFITFNAKIRADDPEFTIKPYFLENNFAILLSKVSTDLPIWVEFLRVFKTAFISLLS